MITASTTVSPQTPDSTMNPITSGHDRVTGISQIAASSTRAMPTRMSVSRNDPHRLYTVAAQNPRVKTIIVRVKKNSPAASGPTGVCAQLAPCASRGNPTTNTGNGFYGMYQFTLETWQSLGGTGSPYEADAATQTAMAKKLQAQAGWGQWPGCADKLGLR